MLPYTWFITKTWLNLLVNHLKEHQKFEIKIKTKIHSINQNFKIKTKIHV
jgi:hypothetical protein